MLDWRDDLAVVTHGYPLSQQILRTDVSGMPLEWVDYREAARLYHTEQVAYTCGTLAVPALRRHLRADRSAHHRRREFDHRDPGDLPAIPANLRGAAYTPPLNNQTLFRRDAYLCLYCGARFTYSLLSRDHVTPFSRGGQDTWSNVVSACRRCNNAKASRTPEQAGMQLLAVPFTPTYAEYIFLKGRRVLADQMEYLIAHFPALEPAARAHATLADVNAGAVQPQVRSGVVYYIDASYFIFRAYHSMPSDMVDGDGNATHALYGFARFISDLLEQVRPERIGVAFDLSVRSATSFRNGIYPAYKANREAPPADLARQFALCREFCRHMGIAEFASTEYEADDIIGTLAARSRAAGLRNVLVTRDKDLSQLIRDGDVFWDYSGNTRYQYHDIGPRFGVNPELIADFLALTGDSVDNIPGVPGSRQEDRSRAVRGVRVSR